jgi:hypothetical protein
MVVVIAGGIYRHRSVMPRLDGQSFCLQIKKHTFDKTVVCTNLLSTQLTKILTPKT